MAPLSCRVSDSGTRPARLMSDRHQSRTLSPPHISHGRVRALFPGRSYQGGSSREKERGVDPVAQPGPPFAANSDMERIFSSRALFRTLAIFFRYPEEPLNPRLISRHTGVDIRGVIHELRKLEEMGILRTREAGRYRRYTLNRRHPAFPGLRSIFGRARKEEEALHRKENDRVPKEFPGYPYPARYHDVPEVFPAWMPGRKRAAPHDG